MKHIKTVMINPFVNAQVYETATKEWIISLPAADLTFSDIMKLKRIYDVSNEEEKDA